MSIPTDELKFHKYMKLKYGVSIRIIHVSYKNVTRKSKRVQNWVNAIRQYFGCTEEDLFPIGRKNNGYHSMWLRYMLHEMEGIPQTMLEDIFNRNRTTIIWNLKTCRNWVDVYPEIYQGIIDKYNQLNKKKKYNYQLKITKHKEV